MILNPLIPTYLLLVIALGLTIFFLWMEKKRETPYLNIRMIGVIVMILSLCAIILRPAYKSSQSTAIILLTPEYDIKKLDSILRLEPQASVIHAPRTSSYKNSKPLKSFHDLTNLSGEIHYILGQGIPRHANDLVEPGSYNFIPAPIPSGITKMNFQHAAISKRINLIEGVFNNASPKTKLFLEGPGGKEDSVELKGKSQENFSLRFMPKQAGNFLYTLSDGDKLKELLPVHVKEERPLNIFFIQHYPTFESRSLKNFLGEHHRLLFRYQLSQNKYRFEFINRESQRIDRLSQEILSDNDLIIIDSDALDALSSSEVKDLQAAVKSGLGIIILFNDLPTKVRKTSSFLPINFTPYASDTAHLDIRSKKITLPAWPVKLTPDEAFVTVLKNKNRLLSGYFTDGFGKAGFQLLQETYQLMLEGDSIAYSELWAGLIGQVARTEKDKFQIEALHAFPLFQDEPTDIEIISSGSAPILYNDSIRIPVSEDLFIDDLWKTKYWAGKPGWHSLTVEEDSIKTFFFVSEKDSWQPLAITNQIEQTMLNSASVQNEKGSREVLQDFPAWIFYLTFLVSAGFLWLAPKL